MSTDPGVRAALGDGPAITEEQERLLDILLDPANDPSESSESLAEALEEFTAFTGTDVEETSQVADRLREHLNREAGTYDAFEFELVRGCDGVVEQYNVLTRFGELTWLTSSEDLKYLLGYRYGLTGLRAALHVAETLLGDHARLLAQKTKLQAAPEEPKAVAERVATALNRAADEVLDLARDDGEELLRDAINLVVNAGLHYLDHPDASLGEAVEANYDEPVDEVIDRVR